MDSSSENPDALNSVNRHWSQDRLHADVHRAVGGMLNLIREVSRISARLDSGAQTDWMIKRVQFLAYELQVAVANEPDNEHRLTRLNRFFFEEKQFRCLSEPARLAQPDSAFRLNQVLCNRAGAPLVLELLYAFLADSIGIRLDFIDLKPTCFLRWRAGGRSRFIDVSRSGQALSTDQLIDSLNGRCKSEPLSASSLLESLSFEHFIADYVTSLKQSINLIDQPEIQLFLQNTLIAYQPSEISLVGERALLHRRLGNFKLALADLKRYFAFHERERAPAELVGLYDELMVVLENQPTHTEVGD